MGSELMEVFVRMPSSKSLKFSKQMIEQLHAEHEWDEVNNLLEGWLLQGEDISAAIHTAVKCRHPSVVLDNYVEFQANIDINSLISLHTLHCAAAGGYDEIVHLLISHSRKTHPEKLQQLINGRDSRRWTALHWACQNGHTQAGRVLIDGYANMNLDFSSARDVLKNREFTTPLHLAIKPSEAVENPLMDMTKSERVALVDLLLKWPKASEMLNMMDWERNTPLHLAVDVMDVDIVELLVKQPRLIGTVKNRIGNTPSALVSAQNHSVQTEDLASVKIIQKYLRRLDDVRDEQQALMDERARYYNAANNLLVGGALLAGVTFAGILSMVELPDEFLTVACVDTLAQSPSPTPWGQFTDLSPGPGPSSTASCTPHRRTVRDVMDYKTSYIRAGDIFRGSNNLSFYFSIVTIMAAIRLVISRPRNIPLETEISRLRNSIVLISLSLTFSTIFAVMAFISGGLAKIPVAESGWAFVLSQWAKGQFVAILKSTMLTSTMLGLILIIPFILIPLLLDDLSILRSYVQAKIDFWDRHNQHISGDVGRWRSLLTLTLASLFLFVGLFAMFILIFGVGLLNDYIELPAGD